MFKLSTDIKITKGFTRDLLLDLGRNKITIIDREVSQFLEEIELSFDNHTEENKQLLQQLLDDEIIFELDEDERVLFPELSTEWHFPAIISNAVFELTKDSLDVLPQAIEQLEAANCSYYSLIMIDELTSEQYDFLSHILSENSIMNIDLALNFYRSEVLQNFLHRLFKTTLVKSRVVVFNCADRDFLEKLGDCFSYRAGEYSSNRCGCINKEHFHLNRIMYNESLSHNTCLNRKVTIDGKGNIRNCPATKNSFGNLKMIKIQDVINQPRFTELWNINKDKIIVCKDCEFRNICTDCRAYIENPEDIYSKPLKCGYNPYTNVWEEWSTNPLKQRAIDFYGMRELIKNKND